MAFPPLPGRRIAYDSDGTAVFMRSTPANGNLFYEMHPAAVKAMNSTMQAAADIPTTVFGGGIANPSGSGNYFPCYILFIFPEPVALAGLFFTAAFATNAGALMQVETSLDSTNGEDGTWTAAALAPVGTGTDSVPTFATTTYNALTGVLTPSQSAQRPIQQNYHKDQSVTPGYGFSRLSGDAYRQVKALRLRPVYTALLQHDATGAYTIHLYGALDTSAGTQRLELWQTGFDLPLDSESLNWGDVSVGSTADRQFKLKNLSSSKKAQTITVYAEDLLGFPTPAPAAEFLFSFDGITWATSVALSELSASATSGVIRIRRTTPTNAPLSVWAPRIRVDVGGWA